MNTDIPDVRLLVVVRPLIAEAPVNRAPLGGLAGVAVLAALVRFQVGVAPNIKVTA